MSEKDDRKGAPIIVPSRAVEGRQLPRRFYNVVTVAGPRDGDTAGYLIHLDGRTARTPGKRELALPTPALAAAIAAEWDAQQVSIDPERMPLTRLANTAVDGVALRARDVAADVVKYAASDLLCYRADFPPGLVQRQAALWTPVLEDAARRLGVRLQVQTGLMPIAQPEALGAAFAAAIAALEPFRLTALHVMTTLMGSAVLALAVLEGRLTADAAWEAAHVDEDWQIAEWGEDVEALMRRKRRWAEMEAAARLAQLAV